MRLTEKDKANIIEALDAKHHMAKFEGREPNPETIKEKTNALMDKIEQSETPTFTSEEAEILSDSLKAIYQMHYNRISQNSLQGLANNPTLNNIKEISKELNQKIESLTENN